MFDTAVSISHSLGAYYLREILVELWRFSFQYGFKMTEHQRLKAADGHYANNSSGLELNRLRLTTVSESDLWRHLHANLRCKAFRVSEAGHPMEPEIELPPFIPCDYLEETIEEVEVKNRCGKPFSNTFDADRFAMSSESLRRTEATWITAGFLRKWVLRDFFGYLMENSATN